MAYWKEHPGLFIGFYVSIGDPEDPESLVDKITGLDTLSENNILTKNTGSAPIEDCYLISRTTDDMSHEENTKWMNIKNKKIVDGRRVNYIQTTQSMLYLLERKIYPFHESHFGKENYLIKYTEV